MTPVRPSLLLPALGLTLLAGGLRADERPGATGATAASATAPAPAARAHELGQSYMYLRVHPDSLIVRVEITVADVERVLRFGWDPDSITVDQARAALDSIRAYVEPRFALSTADEVLPLEFANVDVRFLGIADYVVLTYQLERPTDALGEVDLRYEVLFEIDDEHRNLVAVEHNWKTGTFENESIVALILSPSRPEQSLDLATGSVLQGFLALVWLGVWHIWIGIDHILFLMALILPAVLVRREGDFEPVSSFRQALWNLVAIVSFFTIAHSVTLSLAALDVVRLSSTLVESIIAGSIAVAAFANLMPRLRIREWSIAFVFGLFHGFGFASVMGDIDLGSDYLVLSLFGFNLGVELGQIAVVVAVFPILYLIRRSRFYLPLMRLGSMFLIFVALLWMFERLFDFNVPLIPIATAPFIWLFRLVTGG